MQDFEYSFGEKIFCLRQKKAIAKFAKRKPETDMIVKEPHALPIFIALTYHKHKKVQFMYFFFLLTLSEPFFYLVRCFYLIIPKTLKIQK